MLAMVAFGIPVHECMTRNPASHGICPRREMYAVKRPLNGDVNNCDDSSRKITSRNLKSIIHDAEETFKHIFLGHHYTRVRDHDS